MSDKKKTPYFIPEITKGSKEGVKRLHEEFRTAMKNDALNETVTPAGMRWLRNAYPQLVRGMEERGMIATQQQAEPSEPWREKLIELADQLDAELTTGVQWSNAQFACFYVSDDLRKIVKKAGGVPNEKDWKTRALEAEKLNRQFMERWNAENGPTHMGEPVIAAQQQAEPVWTEDLIQKVKQSAKELGAKIKPGRQEQQAEHVGIQQAEPGADERAMPTPAAYLVKKIKVENGEHAGHWPAEAQMEPCHYGADCEPLFTAQQMRDYAAQSGQRAGVATGVRHSPADRQLIVRGDFTVEIRDAAPTQQQEGE